MPKPRKTFDADFKAGAVQIVLETGRPVSQIADEIGVNSQTLGNWVRAHKAKVDPPPLTEDERAELLRLRKDVKELRVQRDVLKRSVVLWVDDAMGRKS